MLYLFKCRYLNIAYEGLTIAIKQRYLTNEIKDVTAIANLSLYSVKSVLFYDIIKADLVRRGVVSCKVT